MANVILGLLLIAPMSFYDILKAFERGISLFYAASPGSIKRALDKLLAEGHIEVASVDEGARGRKVYRATQSGKALFEQWMRGPVNESSLDTAALARIYFLGHLAQEERSEVLAGIRGRVMRDLAKLEDTEREVDAQPVSDELAHMARYGRATLDYGLMAHRAALEWLENFIRNES